MIWGCVFRFVAVFCDWHVRAITHLVKYKQNEVIAKDFNFKKDGCKRRGCINATLIKEKSDAFEQITFDLSNFSCVFFSHELI